MHSFKIFRLSAISPFRCSNHRIGAPVRNIMEFPHSANSITDIKISITTLSNRVQTFPVLPAPEDTILSREPNSQNQVNIPHRRSRSLSPTHRSSCAPTVYTWRSTSCSLGMRKCHPREFHHPFQKPEGETPAGSFPRPSCGPSEDSFTRPGYGLQGDSCPRPGDEFIQPCGQVVSVFTKANPNFWLAIRDGSVVLAYANPSDEFQQWVMDETFCIVKDEAGHSSFSLVNKATGQALKHGLGETQPDRLRAPVIHFMEFPHGHHQKDHEEERREHEHHRHGFQPSPEFPPPPRGGEYYPPPGTRFEEPGYYAPPPPPQPYAQVEHHAPQPFSQGEEYPAHQGFGHVVHHESQRPFQRPECDTPSDSFPRPSYGTSEGSIPRPGNGPSEGSFSRPGYESALPRGQVVRVICKANPDFWLAIRNGSTVLVHGNANDKSQQWVRDETYSTKVKDETSSPSFSLVNKATCQALKHGLGETQPVLLTQYEPNKFDESILWTTSGDMGQGFRTIRLVNNIHLNLDAFHGDEKSGGIKDGNPVVLWSWKKRDNQLWNIVPF